VPAAGYLWFHRQGHWKRPGGLPRAHRHSSTELGLSPAPGLASMLPHELPPQQSGHRVSSGLQNIQNVTCWTLLSPSVIN
jgi:hypothetical protein